MIQTKDTTPKEGDELARAAARILDAYRRKDGLTSWAFEKNRVNAEQRMTEALAENADRILTALRSQHNGATQGDKVLREALEKIAAGRTIRFSGSEHHGRPLRDKDAQNIAKAALSPSGGMAHE